MLGLPSEENGASGEPPRQGTVPEQRQSPPKADMALNYHVNLCRLLVDGGATALREVFDTIHTPLNLKSRLAKVQAVKILQRLKHRGIITPVQWSLLYPQHKDPQSGNFDVILLHLLLRNVCHLSPPYPNGWDGIPLASDNGLSANLVRLDYMSHLIVSKEEVTDEEYYHHFEQITETLCSLAGLTMRRRAELISQEQINEDQRQYFVEYLKRWEKGTQQAKKAGSEQAEPTRSTSRGGMRLPKIEKTPAADDITIGIRSATPGSDMRDGLHAPTSLKAGRTPSALNRRNTIVRTPGNDFLAQDRGIIAEHHKLVVENVRSDAVLAKLVKAGVLTHEEKNSINLATRNVDRMKSLLKILPTKQRAAFSAFCEALKFKYQAIYETLMKSKKLAMEKPDDVTEATTNLRSSYKSIMSRTTPVPWHANAMIDIRDFYTPLYITDYHGRELNPTLLFDIISRPKNGKGRRIMLEGESGSGKSTICRYITTEWAHSAITVAQKFRLFYHIEVKLLKNSLAETILEHNHESGYNKTPAELYHLISTFQHNVMFVLDGLEDLAPKVTNEVMDLLQGRLFPESCVLVTMNSTYVTPALLTTFDTRLALFGLSPDTQEDFVLRYAKLTKTSEEVYTDLLEKILITDASSKPSLQVLAQNPQLLMCMCLICETETPLEAESTSALLQDFFKSLQKLHCKNNNIPIINGEMPESLQILAQDIEEMAWRCMHQNGSFFMYDQSDSDSGNPMFDLGILQRRTSSALTTLQQIFFTNRIFQDFMVARVLCRLDPEDFTDYLSNLVNDSYYSNVTKFFCGLLKDDYDTDRLGDVMRGLAQVNVSYWTGYAENIRMGSSGELICRRQMPAITEGRLGDFVLSLACLDECVGREDMLKIIADSLPVRLFTKHKKMITHGAIMGLTHVLKQGSSMVVELELRLDHFSRYYGKTLNILGNAINQSKTLSDLKFRWSDSDLLSEACAVIFATECSVRTVSCYDETKRLMEHRVSAAVWSNMKKASQNMASVHNFSFANCQNKAMVTCVLHSLPYSIANLSITNTTLDIVSAQALAKRIEDSQSLTCLDLRLVKINRPDFSFICSGLRLNNTLERMILRGTNLDVISFMALSQALKFNRSLTELDLSMTELSDSACKALAQALSTNKNICDVIMEGTKITPLGKEILVRQTSNANLVLVGIETVTFMPLPYSTFKTRFGQVGLPMLKSGYV